MKRSDWWRQQYHDDRYMNELGDDALVIRLRDVNANAWFVTDELKLGLNSSAVSGGTNYWGIAFTHLLEEFGARGQGLPNPPDLSTMPKLDWPGLASAIPIFKGSHRAHREVLVRYSSYRWISEAVLRGSILIKPASSYNDPSLNSAIRDDELQLTVYRRSKLYRMVYDEFGRILRPAGPTLGHKVEVLRAPTNYYVYCMSVLRSPRLFGDFEADAAFIVHDVRKFVRLLGETVRQRLGDGWTWAARPVRYVDPLRAEPGPLNLFECKHFSYAYQNEFRLVWVPPAPVRDLKPLSICIGSIEGMSTIICLTE